MVTILDEDERSIYNIKNSEFFKHGGTSNVYRLENGELLKRYYAYTTESVRITEDIFKLLQTINHIRMIRMYELFVINNHSVAYTMKELTDDDTDILDTSVDFLLENIKSIEELFDKLTALNIRIMDSRWDNTVVNEKGITIIDPDKYRKVDYNPVTNNKDQLLYLVYSLLTDRKSIREREIDLNKVVRFRNSIKISDTVSITDKLHASLKLVKKPYELFLRD